MNTQTKKLVNALVQIKQESDRYRDEHNDPDLSDDEMYDPYYFVEAIRRIIDSNRADIDALANWAKGE